MSRRRTLTKRKKTVTRSRQNRTVRSADQAIAASFMAALANAQPSCNAVAKYIAYRQVMGQRQES